jgi:L,D-transpeptidase ErfK/SrfK
MNESESNMMPSIDQYILVKKPTPRISMVLTRNVMLKEYFIFMDSLIQELNDNSNYELDEHILVQHNNWIIDTLANTDYYVMKSRGIISTDPQSLVVLRKDQIIYIPDSSATAQLKEARKSIYIDVNVPEYRLRIMNNVQVLHSFPVRVGRPVKKYLAMAGREVNLYTRTGEGEIIRINRNPVFINPSDNRKYTSTKRDDGVVTKLPNIPWLEPVINGHRFGQLIHPTTNPVTLGKAYSNGCIGLKESDMWRVYYYAPIGTKVRIRYDLEVMNEWGDSIKLDNIYHRYISMHMIENDVDFVACHCGLI